MKIRVVLVDDHPIVLDGVEDLFRLQPDLQVVARCADGEQAIAAVRRHQPDVLVLDLRLPKKDGLTVIREMAAERLRTRVLVLTAALDEQEVLEAVRLGVRGVVFKDAAPKMVVDAVRSVHAGRQCVQEGLLWRALEDILQQEASRSGTGGQLTQRETEVVRMVAAGLHNKEIADRLGVTQGTVKTHLHNIYEKIEVSSRVQLTLYAQAKGIV